MLTTTLALVERLGGASITTLREHLGLPPELLAHLCLQLEDAGWLAGPNPGPCHHLEGDAGGCGDCSSGSCGSGARTAHGSFGEGCCGINGAWRVTDPGRQWLAGRRAPDAFRG